MSQIPDTAYKFGCGRYTEGYDILKNCGEEIKRFGKKPFVIGGPTALSIVKDDINTAIKSIDSECVFYEYPGHCSEESAKIISETIIKNNCDVIIGAGGGRIMDFAKLLADKNRLPIINVPTSASTCAACTSLVVLYDNNGKTVGNYYLRQEVNAVIIDYKIMANQPQRLIASGVLDALAKYIEIKNGNKEVNSQNFAPDLITASVLAKHTYTTLLKDLQETIKSVKEKRVSDELKSTVFLSLPVTSIISGISKGFGQSAIGHELYYQIRTNFTKEGLSYLHGEIVAIGLIVQLYYNENYDEIDGFIKLMKDLSMPVTLYEIGIEKTKENFDILYKNMLKSDFVTNDEEHEKRFFEALKLII